MIHRIDVTTLAPARGGAAAADPVGQAIRHQIQEFGTNGRGRVTTSRIFLIDSDGRAGRRWRRVVRGLLADPITESAAVVGDAATATATSSAAGAGSRSTSSRA